LSCLQAYICVCVCVLCSLMERRVERGERGEREQRGCGGGGDANEPWGERGKETTNKRSDRLVVASFFFCFFSLIKDRARFDTPPHTRYLETIRCVVEQLFFPFKPLDRSIDRSISRSRTGLRLLVVLLGHRSRAAAVRCDKRQATRTRLSSSNDSESSHTPNTMFMPFAINLFRLPHAQSTDPPITNTHRLTNQPKPKQAMRTHKGALILAAAALLITTTNAFLHPAFTPGVRVRVWVGRREERGGGAAVCGVYVVVCTV
jgi:hypothetical protein